MFGHGDFLATPIGERDVADDVVLASRSLRGVLGEGRTDFSEDGVGFAVDVCFDDGAA